MRTRVTIEPVELKHAEVLERLISDHAVAETTPSIPHPYPIGGGEAWIRWSQEQRDAGTAYGFSALAGGEFVGSVSILNVSDNQGEIGYWIGRPYWGRGYATLAARQAVDFGFEELALTKLTGKCLARNIGSFRVLEKLGFELIGFTKISKPRWPTPERVAKFVLTHARWHSHQQQ